MGFLGRKEGRKEGTIAFIHVCFPFKGSVLVYQSLFCFTRYCDRSSRQILSSNHVTNRTNNAKRPWTLARYTTHRASLPSPVNSQANIMATNQSHDQRQDTMDTREVHNPPSATNDTEHSRHTRTDAIHTRQRATRLSRSAGPSNSIKKAKLR